MSGDPWRKLRARSAEYYSQKLAEHGPTAEGVDWNSENSQRLRFEQLLRVAEDRGGRAVSLNDFGCGYGALLGFLRARGDGIPYRGLDLSQPMIERARRIHESTADCGFTTSLEEMEPATCTVASGVFNVKLDTPEAQWWSYVCDTIDDMARLSEEGFAFNVLTADSDSDKRRPHLFYAEPADVFEHCRRRYSRWIALLQDYGLYEFTVVVRKERGAEWRNF